MQPGRQATLTRLIGVGSAVLLSAAALYTGWITVLVRPDGPAVVLPMLLWIALLAVGFGRTISARTVFFSSLLISAVWHADVLRGSVQRLPAALRGADETK